MKFNNFTRGIIVHGTMIESNRSGWRDLQMQRSLSQSPDSEKNEQLPLSCLQAAEAAPLGLAMRVATLEGKLFLLESEELRLNTIWAASSDATQQARG